LVASPGGMEAYAVRRLPCRCNTLIHTTISAHMRNSKIVLCVALPALLVDFGLPRGLGSLVMRHTMLCLPFRLLVIWARLLTSGRNFEEAALTLGADDIKTAYEVTVPMLGPALLGSFLLCFTVSFDEFSATQVLVVPRTQTMPIQIYSMIQTGVTPTVNVFATLLTLITVVIPLIAQIAFGAFRRTFVVK